MIMWISKKKYEKAIDLAKKNVDADLQERNEALWKSYNKVEKERNEANEKVRELSTKLREQSEADMVLSALRIIFKAVNGETKENVQALYGSMLYQQQQVASYNQYCGSLLSNLGGIFQDKK